MFNFDQNFVLRIDFLFFERKIYSDLINNKFDVVMMMSSFSNRVFFRFILHLIHLLKPRNKNERF